MAAGPAAPAADGRGLAPVPRSVTVCVVVKDRRGPMASCLAGIAALETPPGAAVDVVVVDNGSTDGTLALLREHERPGLQVLSVAGTVGRARNAAVAASTADVVAFTDSDCVPEPGWLVAGVAPFSDPAVAVVQGRTLPASPVAGSWAVTQDIAARTGLFEACNVLYRREVLLAAGGFGEGIGFFGEDTVAGWRVLRTGARDAFADAARVRHDVTHPGYGWHLRRARFYAHWPALVRDFPEVRESLLWHHLFLRRRSAESLLALVGLATAVRRPVVGLAALPLLWRHRPRGRSRTALREAAGAVAFDLAVEAALLEGSLRHRTVLL